MNYTPRANGDVRHDGPIFKGNSGGGVYDRAGRLVGIAVTLRYCSTLDVIFDEIGLDYETCAAGVSSLDAESPVLR